MPKAAVKEPEAPWFGSFTPYDPNLQPLILPAEEPPLPIPTATPTVPNTYPAGRTYEGYLFELITGGQGSNLVLAEANNTGKLGLGTVPNFTLEVWDNIATSNNTKLWFTKTPTSGSGLRGLRMDKAAADVLPLGLTLSIDGVPQWDTIAIDATTSDLVLAYSHALGTDNIRLRRDTAQMAIGPVVGQPVGGGSGQIQLYAGTAALPCIGMQITCYGSQDGIQLRQGNAGIARAKINFNDGFQMGVDSASANVKDFWISNNNTGAFPFSIGINDEVVLGSSGSNSEVRCGVPIYGNATPLTFKRRTITMASDADKTLTNAEYDAFIVRMLSGVTLTATRNVILPATNGAVWIVYNETSGAQSLLFKTLAGTGVTVANGQHQILFGNGTNILPAGGAA